MMPLISRSRMPLPPPVSHEQSPFDVLATQQPLLYMLVERHGISIFIRVAVVSVQGGGMQTLQGSDSR